MPLASAGNHVPPVSGVPPRLSNKLIGPILLQIFIVASKPASGAGITETSTIASSSEQGPVPEVVYV